MKRFLAAIFFRQAPVKGAFFALTVWITGLYLVGSLFFFCWVNGWLGRIVPYPLFEQNFDRTDFYIFLLISLIFSVYFLGMAMRLCRGKKRFMPEVLMFALLPAWTLLLPVAGLLFGPFGSWECGRMTVILFLLLLILLCFCRKGKLWGTGLLIAWTAGLLMCIMALNGVFTWGAVESEQKIMSDWTCFLGESGWTVWIGFALLLLLAGYLLTAKFLAVQTGERFRSLFGKPVLICWALAAAVYLAFTAMALVAERQVGRQSRLLADEFGYPLTIKGLAKHYYYYDDDGGAQFDTMFWNRIRETYGDDKMMKEPMLGPVQSVFSKEQLAEARTQFDREETMLRVWEKEFNAPLPRPAYRFEAGAISLMELPSLSLVRKFNWFELWRIRFSLADGNFDAALAAYGRMERVTEVLRREVFLLGGLVWLYGEGMRIDALELLLESGKLSDAQLRTIAGNLAEVEAEIPKVLKRSSYSEMIGILDFVDLWNAGKAPESIPRPPQCELSSPSRNSVMLFFPQLRWLSELDKWDILNTFLSFAEGEAEKRHSYRPRLLQSLLPAMDVARVRFVALSARLRAMRALIDAELYRREHGNFPEAVDNLPSDPFGSGPLRYRKGECMLPQAEKLLNFGILPENPKLVPVSAVQVWSVGWNGRDDGGTGDDIRAIMRIGVRASE